MFPELCSAVGLRAGLAALTLACVPPRTPGRALRGAARRGTEPGYALLGATVEKAFSDPAAQITLGPVQYRVRATRGTLTSGYASPVVFNFGPGGGFTVSVGESTPAVRMAA